MPEYRAPPDKCGPVGQTCGTVSCTGRFMRVGAGGFAFALRACRCYAKLIWRYLRCPRYEVVVVGYPGYIDILLARLLNLFSKRTLVLVSFISLYDTAVMDRQSVSPGSMKGRLLYAIDRCAFRCADWVLVDTQELGSHYANLFNIPRDKFRKSMVGNIFDRFPAASRESVQAPSFRVLFFGTYVPLHGAECIVKPLEHFAKERVEFTLIGQGQDYATVRERASGLEHVRFVETWLSAEEASRGDAGGGRVFGDFWNDAQSRSRDSIQGLCCACAGSPGHYAGFSGDPRTARRRGVGAAVSGR